MRPRPLALLLCMLLVGRSAPPLAAQQACIPGRTALVLAGGGAKGLVHIGVIRMLDSLGIRPDFVVGTSMGAIVGALYASGYSDHDLDSLARSLPLSELVRPRAQASSRAYTLYRPLIYWEIDGGKIRLAQAAVPEQGTDAALNRALLRSNLQALGDFGRLPIPFYAVATDLATRQAVPLHSGDLAQAVRASMAIPILFEPVRIDGRTLADGGLVANVPIRVARELGATRLIISDLVRRPSRMVDFESPLSVATALIDYLFSQSADSAIAGDVLISTDVTGVGNLDFTASAQDTLVSRGARTAREALTAEGTCLPHGPAPALATDTTAFRVVSLTVPELKRRELEELLGTLGLAQGVLIEPRVLRRGFDALARDGRFRAVWLNPTPQDSGIALDLQVLRAPAGGVGVGIAFDTELGARMWTGAVLRDPVTRTFEFTGIVTFGGLRRDIQGAARRRISMLGRPSLLAGFFAGQEEIPFFTTEGDRFARPQISQAVGTMGWEWQVGGSWLFRLAGEARAWSDTSNAGHEALGGIFAAQRATDDGEILSAIEINASRRFQRLALQWKEPIEVGRWIVTPALRFGTIQGDEIPPQLTFPLGGSDGFPGLHLLERRGDHEAFVETSASYQLDGSLRVVVEVAVGDARMESPGAARALFRGEGWLVGGRVGLGIRPTPLGPVRLEYGATNVRGDYRDQVFLRVGRWF
ncbi:MAG: patatin-like phospholipase family protein [Gemmatimonadota bacterium]